MSNIKKLAFLIISVFVVLLLFSFVLGVFSQKKIKTIAPTPSPIPADRPVPGENYQTITKDDLEQIKRENAVGALIKKLPYEGINFSFSYSFSENRFVLTLFGDREKEGNDELNRFLKDNNVIDRSWIRNLVVIVE